MQSRSNAQSGGVIYCQHGIVRTVLLVDDAFLVAQARSKLPKKRRSVLPVEQIRRKQQQQVRVEGGGLQRRMNAFKYNPSALLLKDAMVATFSAGHYPFDRVLFALFLMPAPFCCLQRPERRIVSPRTRPVRPQCPPWPLRRAGRRRRAP